jgi:hypothetical protein
MSAWLNLAKVPEDLLREIIARPDLLEALFFEDDSEPPAIIGAVSSRDILGCDYRTVNAVADALAREAGAGDDWRTDLPWLARAVGVDPAHPIDEYRFTYGPAFFIQANEVAAIRDGLIAEGWSFPETVRDEPDPRRRVHIRGLRRSGPVL